MPGSTTRHSSPGGRREHIAVRAECGSREHGDDEHSGRLPAVRSDSIRRELVTISRQGRCLDCANPGTPPWSVPGHSDETGEEFRWRARASDGASSRDSGGEAAGPAPRQPPNPPPASDPSRRPSDRRAGGRKLSRPRSCGGRGLGRRDNGRGDARIRYRRRLRLHTDGNRPSPRSGCPRPSRPAAPPRPAWRSPANL